MEHRDRIYGVIDIKDPVILELIGTPTFQRLRRVNQYGGVNLVYPNYQVSRFEHSVGVWWVLKNLGTPIDTQVSGLLHDLAHTAFSHMVDMAMANKDEDFHEGIDTNLSKQDRIRGILEGNGIDIIEADGRSEIRPGHGRIGADQLDYGMRDYYGSVGRDTLFGREVLNNITLIGGHIVFKDVLIARRFALTSLKAMWNVIYHPRVAVVYQSLIEMIRVGFRNGWLKNEDLRQDDQFVLSLMRKNRSDFNRLYLDIFEKSFDVEEVSEGKNSDFHHVKLKARYFDPIIDVGDGQKSLTEVDPGFLRLLKKNEEVFEARKKGVYLKVTFR